MGAVGLASIGAGCTSSNPLNPGNTDEGDPTASPTHRTATPPDTRAHPKYDNIIDMGKAGADPSGSRSIVPHLYENAQDDTLLRFPPGRYLMDEPFALRSFSNFGIVGDETTIVPEDGDTNVLFHFGGPSHDADGFLMESMEFDFRAPDTGPRPLSVQVGNFTVRDVSVKGPQDAGWGMMRLDVTDPDGLGLVEKMQLPDGALNKTNSTGCYVGESHQGEIIFEDCTIAGFADNGLYAEPKQGSVQVLGGFYANSNISNVRVGSNSLVHRVHIRCDREPDGFGNMRGIRLRQGENILVENCLVEMNDVVGSDGGIVLAPWLESATIRDTTVVINTDGIHAINIKEPELEPSALGLVRLDNIRIRGGATGRAAINVVDRPEFLFESLDIRQFGENRDGIEIDDSNGVIRDSYIEVTGVPIRAEGSDVSVKNVTTPDGPLTGTPTDGTATPETTATDDSEGS